MRGPWLCFCLLSSLASAAPVTIIANGPKAPAAPLLVAEKFGPKSVEDQTGRQCKTPHPLKGGHIHEVWDSRLNKYVFAFDIHMEDDDCYSKASTRQRLEVKTYRGSDERVIACLLYTSPSPRD